MTQIVDDGVEGVPGDHPVGDLGCFRQTGSAAGEDQRGDIFFLDSFAGHRFARAGFQHTLIVQAALDPGAI